MKIYCALIFLTLVSLIVRGQEYSFPLYFEDSAGNRDTLFFGFDKNATKGVDESMGEVNILGEPYDSTFFVFFSNATYYDELDGNLDCYLKSIRTPTFLSKYQYTNIYMPPFEIGIIAKYWPITLYWNKSVFKEFDSNEFWGEEGLSLLMTSWNPPGGWFDAKCCGSWPNYFTLMENIEQITVDQKVFCNYKANYTPDSINLLFVGLEDPRSSLHLNHLETGIEYNKDEKEITISNNFQDKKVKVRIINVLGGTLFEKKIDFGRAQIVKVPVNQLMKGICLVYILDYQNNNILTSKKVQIQ
jgi:hypothetical protein